ncbi:transmembrane protein 207 [Tachyglossus aculeatus]|uniref:transmembrane protein 207 n=1 Tax=Tachyglossus aculeatus TaxID=9261 RepID=UPI0018F290EF|nr:transmembrane protein 207 [Tachyglossus aculeatus]
MSPGTSSSSMSVNSKTGILCLILLQFVSSDPPCEENEPCINYNDHLPSAWLIWLFMLLFPAALLCCGMLFCLQCWIKRTSQGSAGRTVAVFAISDLDSIYETAVPQNPFPRVCLHSHSVGLCPVSNCSAVRPPPSYEDLKKTSKLLTVILCPTLNAGPQRASQPSVLLGPEIPSKAADWTENRFLYDACLLCSLIPQPSPLLTASPYTHRGSASFACPCLREAKSKFFFNYPKF